MEPVENDKTLFKNIYKNNKKKTDQKINIYNTILLKCEKKIKYYADNNQFSCYFEMPRFSLSCPLYNIEECVFFMMQKLQTKFKVHYFKPEDLVKVGIAKNNKDVTGILYISWNHIKDKINNMK
jgi:hypothetical protein